MDYHNPVSDAALNATLPSSVELDDDVLMRLTEQAVADADDLPDWQAPVFPDASETSFEEMAHYLLVGNVLNFHFIADPETGARSEVTYNDIPWDGAFGMWAGLKRSVEWDEMPDLTDALTLRDLGAYELMTVFEPPSLDVGMPLIYERTEMLREVGTVLSEQYDGSFANVVDAGEHSAAGIVSRLVEDFPLAYGSDRWTYDGETVPFDKRAQLAAGMLVGASQNYDVTIDDVDYLTLYADYGVPATLRGLGALDVSPALGALLDAGTELPAGTVPEVGLRLATVLAGERMRTIAAEEFDTTLDMAHLDYWLWSQRNDVDVTPHYTQTTAY